MNIPLAERQSMMKEIRDIQSELEINAEGEKTLIDRVYKGVNFGFIQLISPLKSPGVRFENVIFESCSISSKHARLGGKMQLNHVVFDEVNFGKEIYIASEVILNQVVFRNTSKKIKLEIKSPIERQNIHVNYPEGHVALDITDFHGEVFISNLASSVIKINPDRHVVVKGDDFEKVDWSEFEDLQKRFWRYYYKKIIFYRSSEGVFTLPQKTHQYYDKVMEGLDILRGQGFL